MSRRRRHPATALTALLCIMALGLCGVIAVLARTPPVPAGTGDPLVDAVLAESADRNSAAGDGHDGIGSLPREWFETQVPVYGSDPQFWIVYARTGELGTEWMPVLDIYERGIAAAGPDPALLLQRLLASQSSWEDEAGQSLNLPFGTTGERRERRRAIAAEAFRLHRTEYEPLAAQLLAADGDEALVHYALASLAVRRGDFEASLALVRSGNAAPGLDPLSGPVERAMDSLLSEPDPDPVMVALLDYLHRQLDYLHRPLGVRTQDFIAWGVPEAARRRDGQALDDFAHMFVRLGSSESSGEWMRSYSLVRQHYRIAGEVQTWWPERMDAERAAGIAELTALRDALEAAIKASPVPAEPGLLKSAEVSIRDAFSRGGNSSLLHLQQLGRHAIEQHRIIQQHAPPYLERAKTFSYR